MQRTLGYLSFLVLALTFVIPPNPASAAGSPTTTVAHLPNVQINAAQVDGSGNIYVAGQNTASSAAYIAKLSPGGTIVFAVTLGGRGASSTSATVLTIDPTGAVYAAGTTTAKDFPVTAGASQSAGATAFAAKLDPAGTIVYAALIGGSATTSPSSIVVNSKKELVVSGQQLANNVQSLFILKLSADGAQVVTGPPSIGGLLTVDSHDNIYVAGFPPAGAPQPAVTAGAFQGVPNTYYCGCPFLNYACGGNQFVASLTPDLSAVRFLTYVTAKYGAVPVYIGLDAQGNILIAGTTSAPGYPTTPGSYEPTYTAANSIVLTCGPPIPFEVTSPSGYVTLVKPDGSGLVFSTFLSGSKNDSIKFAALTSAGIYLAGQAGSVDLPGFDGAVPSPCLPVGFVTRMTPDGSAISSSRTPPGTPVAYDATNQTLLLTSGNDLLRFDLSKNTPIACVLDSAGLNPVTSVAPGELISVFGRFLYFGDDPLAGTPNPANGSYPTSVEGLSVTANQTLAPLLYVSETQLNVQAPYEIAGGSQADLAVSYSDVNGNLISDFRTVPEVAANPIAFLSQPSSYNQSFPLALNADGTVNSLTNAAAAGSIVTLFIDGLGLTNPAPVTGMVNRSSVPLSEPVTVTPDCMGTFCYPAPTFVSAASLAGSISGVTQVQVRAPANQNSPYAFQVVFSLSVGSTPVRNTNLTIWAK